MDGEEWMIEDLESTNGTYLNNMPLSDPTPLAAGDEISLGQTGQQGFVKLLVNEIYGQTAESQAHVSKTLVHTGAMSGEIGGFVFACRHCNEKIEATYGEVNTNKNCPECNKENLIPLPSVSLHKEPKKTPPPPPPSTPKERKGGLFSKLKQSFQHHGEKKTIKRNLASLEKQRTDVLMTAQEQWLKLGRELWEKQDVDWSWSQMATNIKEMDSRIETLNLKLTALTKERDDQVNEWDTWLKDWTKDEDALKAKVSQAEEHKNQVQLKCEEAQNKVREIVKEPLDLIHCQSEELSAFENKNRNDPEDDFQSQINDLTSSLTANLAKLGKNVKGLGPAIKARNQAREELKTADTQLVDARKQIVQAREERIEREEPHKKDLEQKDQLIAAEQYSLRDVRAKNEPLYVSLGREAVDKRAGAAFDLPLFKEAKEAANELKRIEDQIKDNNTQLKQLEGF